MESRRFVLPRPSCLFLVLNLLHMNRRHVQIGSIQICLVLFMEIRVQAVVEIYCCHITCRDISSSHLRLFCWFQIRALDTILLVCSVNEKNLPNVHKVTLCHFKESLWVCLCIPLSLLGNGSVNTFPRQRKIVGRVVFYTVRVVSKESR
jgi:hypothetical protein